MAATVLASTLLLGACGNKKETIQASSSAKTSQSSSSKAASASKESKTQKSSSSASSSSEKAKGVYLINHQQLQRHHKRHLHQSKDKVKKCLINRRLVNELLLRLLQLNRLLKPSLTNQAMILQLTANFKTNKQSKINATRVF